MLGAEELDGAEEVELANGGSGVLKLVDDEGVGDGGMNVGSCELDVSGVLDGIVLFVHSPVGSPLPVLFTPVLSTAVDVSVSYLVRVTVIVSSCSKTSASRSHMLNGAVLQCTYRSVNRRGGRTDANACTSTRIVDLVFTHQLRIVWQFFSVGSRGFWLASLTHSVPLSLPVWQHRVMCDGLGYTESRSDRSGAKSGPFQCSRVSSVYLGGPVIVSCR